MSENECLNIITSFINQLKEYEDEEEKLKQAIETLLDLYNKEKEKNKKLEYKINQISHIIDTNPYTVYTLYGDILYDDQAIRDVIEDTNKFKGELF